MEEGLSLVNARLRSLMLTGVHCRSIAADNVQITGSLFIRGESLVEGEISLAGGRVGSDLQICGAEIQSSGQDAIFAPSLVVEGSMFLGNYPYADGQTDLKCQGMIFLSSARIGHDLFVSRTAIGLNCDMVGDAMFGATEEHGHDMALSLARAKVGGILYLQDNQINSGIVNLAGASVERLTDDPSCPGANYRIRLDGFLYRDFSRHADTAVQARLDRLARRPEGTPFTAQPYEQLAKVLIGLGHRDDAHPVLMRKERLIRAERQDMALAKHGQGLVWFKTFAADVILRWTVGYGYRPGRSIVMAFALILGLAWLYQQCWRAGDMTPNAAPILILADWVAATKAHPDNPAAFWSEPGQAGQDWETFHPIAYAADLFIPIVSLGQEEAWAPSTSRSDWGRVGWWVRWFAKAIGWVVTALGAAAITGVIRRD